MSDLFANWRKGAIGSPNPLFRHFWNMSQLNTYSEIVQYMEDNDIDRKLLRSHVEWRMKCTESVFSNDIIRHSSIFELNNISFWNVTASRLGNLNTALRISKISIRIDNKETLNISVFFNRYFHEIEVDEITIELLQKNDWVEWLHSEFSKCNDVLNAPMKANAHNSSKPKVKICADEIDVERFSLYHLDSDTSKIEMRNSISLIDSVICFDSVLEHHLQLRNNSTESMANTLSLCMKVLKQSSRSKVDFTTDLNLDIAPIHTDAVMLDGLFRDVHCPQKLELSGDKISLFETMMQVMQ